VQEEVLGSWNSRNRLAALSLPPGATPELQEPPGGTTVVLMFLTLDVHNLQCFSDALKVGLLVFLELWLGTYPLSCGSR